MLAKDSRVGRGMNSESSIAPPAPINIKPLPMGAAHCCQALVAVAFCCWTTKFISLTSVVAPDGHRYFTLFDDAMISMRYAWNLVQGHGPVWNIGEHVEGYTNPLWVLIMAGLIFVFGHDWAPLTVSILGAVLALATAWLVGQLAARLLAPRPEARLAGLVAMTLTLIYYPLLYWSLNGMEVSLLAILTVSQTLLLVDDIGGSRNRSGILISAILVLIAYAARPDGIVNLVPLAGIIAVRRIHRAEPYIWLDLSACIAILAFPIGLHLFWRHAYYGSWVPNTYTLKIAGYSLGWRLQNGVHFVTPFFQLTAPLIGMAIIGAFVQRRRLTGLFLLSPLGCSVAYQIYVGGDAFVAYRQLAPSMTLVIVLAVVGAIHIAATRRKELAGFAIAAGLWAFGWAELLYGQQLIFYERPYQAVANRQLALDGLALRDVLLPDARILAFWACNLPYYWRGPTDDALGKSDAQIAALPPHHRPRVLGMIGLPGHSKYDLVRSIQTRRPDLIQYWKWAGQDLSDYVRQNYVGIRTADGVNFCVRRDSPRVYWSRITIAGNCVVSHEGLFDPVVEPESPGGT